MSIKFTFSLLLLLLLSSIGQAVPTGIPVTVNREAGKPETTTSSVIFIVKFSSAITPTSFTTSSVILSGTATNTSVDAVFEVAPKDGTNFKIVVSGDNNGSIMATIPANTTSPFNAESTSSDNGYVLPVNLLYFTASDKECTTTFNWKSSGEINNSYYGIETSADGKAFAPVAKVTSKNSANGATYVYTLKEAGGTTYYRLKMVDKDGSFSYSKIITVIANGNCGTGLKLKLSPNPAKDFVNIEGLVKGNHLSILNAAGIALVSLEATGNTQRINISKFAKGIYTLRVKAADGSLRTVKFVKL